MLNYILVILLVTVLKNDLLLHEAVIKNDVEAVRRVLREHTDINSRNNVSKHQLLIFSSVTETIVV